MYMFWNTVLISCGQNTGDCAIILLTQVNSSEQSEKHHVRWIMVNESLWEAA